MIQHICRLSPNLLWKIEVWHFCGNLVKRPRFNIIIAGIYFLANNTSCSQKLQIGVMCVYFCKFLLIIKKKLRAILGNTRYYAVIPFLNADNILRTWIFCSVIVSQSLHEIRLHKISRPEVFYENVLLNIWQNSQENAYSVSIFSISRPRSKTLQKIISIIGVFYALLKVFSHSVEHFLTPASSWGNLGSVSGIALFFLSFFWDHLS